MIEHSYLPYGRQHVDDSDIQEVISALRGNYLTTGPYVEKFEHSFADIVGASCAVACSSGTTALHLISVCLGLDADSAVIVPSQTFLATANGPHYTGAEVVFADCDPDTGLMRAEDLSGAIRKSEKLFPDKKMKAVFFVHLNGQSADMPTLSEVARSHNLFVVEDACHALGGLTLNAGDPGSNQISHPVGNCHFSDAAIFSGHPVKAVAMGEGGVITTNNRRIAAQLRSLRSHAMQHGVPGDDVGSRLPDVPSSGAPWYYEMCEMGYNYRIPDILCALGLSQLKKLDTFQTKRRQLADHYMRRLQTFHASIQPPACVSYGRHAWHLMTPRIEFGGLGMTRDVFIRQLGERGIGSQVHYIPVHLQPYWQKRYGRVRLPGAETYYVRTLSLPLFHDMDVADVDRVLDTIGVIVGAH